MISLSFTLMQLILFPSSFHFSFVLLNFLEFAATTDDQVFPDMVRDFLSETVPIMPGLKETERARTCFDRI